MRRAAIPLTLVAAACAPATGDGAVADHGGSAPGAAAVAPGLAPERPPSQAAPPPGYRPDPRGAPPRVTVPEDMARMLAAVRYLEVPGRPCLERDPPRRELPPGALRKLRAMQAAGGVLRKELMSRARDRLLAADFDFGLDETVSPRFVVKVTGTEPLPALSLGGAARHVPVVVEYGLPHDFENLRKLFMAGSQRTAELVPTLNGASLRTEGYGYKRLYVHSPDGRPDEAVLAQCEALRAASRMPVLIRFETAGPQTSL